MKDVIICGKANIGIPVEALRKGDAEFWMLGTDKREGADKYFELHGIKVEHENTFYELPDEVYNQGLPVNNSISALAIYASGAPFPCFCCRLSCRMRHQNGMGWNGPE